MKHDHASPMRRLSLFTLHVLLMLLLAGGLAGCGKPVPKTLALEPPQEVEARDLLRRFQEREHPSVLDADLRVGWETWGSKGSSAAVLQMQRPANLRFSMNDPLGRPMLLLVSDDYFFTLVNNQTAQAWQGRSDSAYWQEYLPVSAGDLFFMLGGRLTDAPMDGLGLGLDQGGQGFWYNWVDRQMLEHYVLLNRLTGRMDRRLLFDRQGELALEISYSAYRMIPDSGFSWPGHLLIKGEGIRGSLTVQVEHFYPPQDFAPATFLLTIPPHFTVEDVN